jgi:hypothetical protein
MASGRGIDHRGRSRTVKEDRPSNVHSTLAGRAAGRKTRNVCRMTAIDCIVEHLAAIAGFRPNRQLVRTPRMRIPNGR